ncbi:hypothetical protein JOB18_038940 [Solea senegalensis]|uniref:Uncharacterized protein n=1 Tax=Solea senegalensis TaxID=28829 RepID=A0AAV6SIJ4_SOLSE|nr:hypothetical protein JOB18_038940 [Solea senegalensis]
MWRRRGDKGEEGAVFFWCFFVWFQEEEAPALTGLFHWNNWDLTSARWDFQPCRVDGISEGPSSSVWPRFHMTFTVFYVIQAAEALVVKRRKKPTFLEGQGAAVKSNCSNRFGTWPARPPPRMLSETLGLGDLGLAHRRRNPRAALSP